jgi:aryl-alcohol dehydrogenase-like predicted oxidoreductase
MEQRRLGRTGRDVSVVGLGAWQLGADWGEVAETDALAVVHAAVDSGVTFIDTADVYDDGRSERVVGRVLRERPDAGLTVATKMGRRLPQLPENYVRENFLAWTERSRQNLQVDTLDLVQLHCPPTAVYRSDAVYDALDELVQLGRIAAYGVSVEECEQALAAIARPAVASVQIILNCLRPKPLEQVLPAAQAAGVAIIARVPLASGLLSGKYDESTTFATDDHRNYNRNGEAFDVGETFAGVPYEAGVDAAVAFSRIAAETGVSPAHLALRWIIDQPGVTTVIPGASSVEQARANATAAEVVPISEKTRTAIRDLYDEQLRPLVHDKW